MYPNFRAEYAKKKFTLDKLVDELDKRGIKISASHLSQKLNGVCPIRLNEAKALKEILGTDLTIEELFEVEEGE